MWPLVRFDPLIEALDSPEHLLQGPLTIDPVRNRHRYAAFTTDCRSGHWRV